MEKKRCYLRAEMIYKYLMGDEKLETQVMCKPNDLDLVTTDQSLYEALGSIEDKSKINYSKFVKFLEVVDVMSFRYSMKKNRKVLKIERVKEIQEKSKNDFDLNNIKSEAM
jgi:hypothetical protein